MTTNTENTSSSITTTTENGAPVKTSVSNKPVDKVENQKLAIVFRMFVYSEKSERELQDYINSLNIKFKYKSVLDHLSNSVESFELTMPTFSVENPLFSKFIHFSKVINIVELYSLFKEMIRKFKESHEDLKNYSTIQHVNDKFENINQKMFNDQIRRGFFIYKYVKFIRSVYDVLHKKESYEEDGLISDFLRISIMNLLQIDTWDHAIVSKIKTKQEVIKIVKEKMKSNNLKLFTILTLEKMLKCQDTRRRTLLNLISLFKEDAVFKFMCFIFPDTDSFAIRTEIQELTKNHKMYNFFVNQ
jgi:hypothetical protein